MGDFDNCSKLVCGFKIHKGLEKKNEVITIKSLLYIFKSLFERFSERGEY